MDEEKIQPVKVKGQGDPGPAMLFIFTLLVFMLFGMSTGFFPAPDSYLACGLIMIACFPAYLYGGISYIQQGDTLSGCTYLIFATCFGGIGAVSNLLAWWSAVNGIAFNSVIIQLVWLWSGLILIPVVSSMRKGPWVPFVSFIFGAIVLTFMGLIGLGFLPASWMVLVQICMVLLGVGGFYVAIAQLFQAGGINAPLGRPLVRK